MKIGVVQTAGSLHSGEGEIPDVLKVCIRSVKAWCKYNGYEHCLVPQPNTHYEICRHPDFNRGYRKYEVCAQVADQYDYIIYLDADMMCWGNPRIPIVEDKFMCIAKGHKSWQYYPWYDGKRSAHGYFFAGPSHWFKQLYSWIEKQMVRETRCDGVISDQYLEWNCKNWDLTNQSSWPRGMLFHDEVTVRHWIHENRDQIKFIKPWTIIEDIHGEGDISPTRFFHYVGANKDRQHAFMWTIMQAYKSNRELYRGWRETRSLIVNEYTKS